MDSGLSSVPTIRQGLPGSGDERWNSATQRANGQQPGAYAAPAKPLPPNDFQKFVLESTGQALPLFGAGFFDAAPDNFNPQASAPVSGDYRLGPGDELQIRGWGSVDIDVRAVVDRNGQIHIPRVGAVPLAGVRSVEAESTIRNAVGRYYKDFQLSVTMGQLRGITVYVVGQARKPGAYNLSGASTLVSALFASGGPSANGSMRNVQVKRGGRTVTELDLYDFLAKGDKSADVRLQDGDTITIPPARGYIALTGKVATPAVYELGGDKDTLGSTLALAGGLPVVADPKRAYLERVDPSKKPARSVESFALDAAGLNRPLRNGDLLTVLSLSPEFGNAVTLRGNVDQPVRAPWREGMKIRDLIPSKSYLMSRASVQRQNSVLLTTEEKQRVEDGYQLTRRAQDASSPRAFPGDASGAYGNGAPGQPLDRPGPRLRGEGGVREVRDNADTLAERIGNLVDEINLEYAVVERVDSQNVTVQLVPFNLGRALEDANSPDNLALQPGDIVTVFSVTDVRVPQAKRQVFVRIEGEVRRPGIYQMNPGDGLSNLLEKAGGLTPDAYLFGSAFYREEVRQTQQKNLEQLVRRLEAQTQTQLSSSAASVSAVSGDASGTARLRLEAEARAQQQALERLRNINPTGRIMLGLQADNATVDALPDVRLANQDRLVIPSRPDFVYVLGSVNTEASMLWRRGGTVQDYLSQAGLTSGADKDELFIIRADGSVASGNNSSSWFNRSITGAAVQPGDLIVLPEKTDHESAWSVFTRNAKDITQIIYQFSLGAAAIKTLRE
ncbi:polysaccharide export protein [Aquabacterium soli]|uniref:Polysaccharide export protein n=2 Tax=Aquabacterium soli TaxID=2493092 RepID=A0A3R8T5A7_9BURK|nr:polysaccharide export protein [Aquabacterium soli]